MAIKDYIYNVTTDFGGAFSLEGLEKDILSGGLVTQLDGISVQSVTGQVTVSFRDTLPDNEKILLDGVIGEENHPPHAASILGRHTGASPSQVDEVQLVSDVKPALPEVWFHTPNWCDMTTWYPLSRRITGETLKETGDTRTTFATKRSNIVDLTHGKVPDEDAVSPPYLPRVYINGIQKTEATPFKQPKGGDGDFHIDYKNGKVIFHTPIGADDIVTMDYSWAKNSMFCVAPQPGTKLKVQSAEAEFTTNFNMLDTVIYEGFAFAAVVAEKAKVDVPTLQAVLVAKYGSIEKLNSLVGKLDEDGEGTSEDLQPFDKVPTGARRVYKRMWDFKAQSTGNYAELPAVGGSTRGIISSSVSHPFAYKATKTLDSAFGVEARIWLESHTEFGGGSEANATATFYTLVYD